MYLISQMWWLLLLAFLLGALLGYLLWRACGRRVIEAGFERERQSFAARFSSHGGSQASYSAAVNDIEREKSRLAAEIAVLQNAARHSQTRIDELEQAARGHAGDIARIRQEAEAAAEAVRKKGNELK